MSSRKNVALAWSGGKDSALMLHGLRAQEDVQVACLLTTVTPEGKIAMHGVEKPLLDAQARALGLPLRTVTVPEFPANAVYEAAIMEAFAALRDEGIAAIAFGDLFLEDIRAWREVFCRRAGMETLYPLWGQDTKMLADRFVALGFKARLCCVDTRKIPADFAGRRYDRELLAALPDDVDPCGENGEFHSFVHDGPGFSEPVPCQPGETVLINGFSYCKLKSCALISESL